MYRKRFGISLLGLLTMNREAFPLLLFMLIPLTLVSIILLYFYGYNFAFYLRKIDLIHYIIVLPFVLGIVAALLKIRKPK